jgi:hypothetical protein
MVTVSQWTTDEVFEVGGDPDVAYVAGLLQVAVFSCLHRKGSFADPPTPS